MNNTKGDRFAATGPRSLGLVAVLAVAAIIGFGALDQPRIGPEVATERGFVDDSSTSTPPVDELEPALRRLESGSDQHG